MKTDRYASLLRRVEKPGRYTGGEFGETLKENASVRMCFCFWGPLWPQRYLNSM